MMLLPQERDLAAIIRESEPTILNFELIKHLAARWENRECPCRQNDSGLVMMTQDKTSDEQSVTGGDAIRTSSTDAWYFAC